MVEFQPLLESFAKEKGFVRFQIDSYNEFVENGLQRIIDEIGEIRPEVPEIGELVIRLGKVTVGEPVIKEADGSVRKILPMEARIRDLTYAAPIYLEMTPVVNGKEQDTVEAVIGSLPVMVKSKLCPLSRMSREELIKAGEDPDDPGGYFIINGTERVLVLIEEIAPNRIIVERLKSGNYREIARINSERNGFVQRHLIERKNDGSVYITFASIKKMPVAVMLKALGMESDKEIIENLSKDEDVIREFYYNLYLTGVTTQKEAVEYIGSYLKVPKETMKERVDQVLDRYLLPHIGQDKKARKEKAIFLLKAVEKLILLAQDKIPEDDLDHYANKRLKLSGDLLEVLFRSALMGNWGLIKKISGNYQKLVRRGKLPPVQTVVEANTVNNLVQSALATGSWVGGRTGVSQRLERTNYLRTLSHLRSVISPLASSQEHFEARELHATHFGRLCPAQTPEGPTIGLRKYLALMAEITGSLTSSEKRKLLSSLKLSPLNSEKVSVYLDGQPVGSVEDGKALVEELRKKRRSGLIPHTVNVAFLEDISEVRINTDAGRLRRPLVVVENGKPKLTEEHIRRIKEGSLKWSDLIKKGIIEYLDAEEEENAIVAASENELTDGHTHLELSPLVALGLSASLCIFPQHNRGDRVLLGAKMLEQAIGLYQSSFPLRTDTKSNVLTYPQEPLVSSKTAPVIGVNHHPAGQNVVIAIATYQGYNMEDAIVINKASIERGLFRSFFFRVYTAEEKRYWGGQEDVIGIPDKDVRGYRTEEDYRNLSEDGTINLEVPVGGNDVLVGRTSPMRFLTTELMAGISNRRETSVTLRHGERGIVDRVFITESANGNKLIKVAVRDERIPELGDKFATRHGQKGVIGLIVDEENMPFTSSGIIPDIIFNPHSIPTRQTIGQLLEILAGKAAALSGRKLDGSPFSDLTEEKLKEILKSFGFRSDGKEVMYSGTTGERFEVEIFTGMVYFQKLDHMVADKIHARSRGPVALLTKQPTEGRAKEGGLRLGEMEKDCLIAHGAVLTLKERFSSDKTTVPICKKCGIIAVLSRGKEKYQCPLCKDSDVAEVEMSYAFKLLLDELKAMLIYPKINVKE
ncbi:MAG: DNA-directed RNA polymerase subunit B [Candidatus Micrarchaeota archaeon]|nr:DNA-directed RNA polymerase subunit B [Candidatus Micrarchaeota archaeon]